MTRKQTEYVLGTDVSGRRPTKNLFLNLEKRHAQESFVTSLYENGEMILG